MMKRLGLGCVLIVIFIITLVTIYFFATFEGVIATIEPSQTICENMIDNNLLDCVQQCTITEDPKDYIPKMFPAGVDPLFVESAMNGFYLLNQQTGSSQSILTYWLREREPMLFNRLGIVLPQKVGFYFNHNNELTHFDINNSSIIGPKVTDSAICE